MTHTCHVMNNVGLIALSQPVVHDPAPRNSRSMVAQCNSVRK